MRRGVAAVLAVLTGFGSPARAEPAPPSAAGQVEVQPDPAAVASSSIVPLDEVVVTGTKSKAPAWDSTVPVQVIPEEVIRESTTIDVENVLGEVPGLYIRRNEQFALGASTVRMQGVDANKVAILVDGRRFRGGIDGVVDLRDIPANNIERVEIIRGPASSLYGSDAMAGVINFITKQGTPEPHAELAFARGDFHRRFVAGSHGWQVGPVRYFLSGVHDSFRIFEQFGNISQQFSGPNQDQTQDRSQVGLRLDWGVGQRHAFTLFHSYQEQSNPESTNRNIVLGGEWAWKTTSESELVTWLNRYNFTRSNDLAGFEEDSDYVDWEGESRWAYGLGSWPLWLTNQITVGTRVRQQVLEQGSLTLQGNEGPITTPAVNASIWQVSPYLQTDAIFTEQWSLSLGSSFDVHERYGLDVNPRATLTWRPWGEHLRISGTVGRGFRAPDLTQLFGVDINFGGLYALLGNPDLQPETDLAFQLETQFRWRGVDAFLVLFRHQFDDLIAFTQLRVCVRPGVPAGCVPDPLPQLPGRLRFQTTNLAKALTQGLELGIDVEPLALMGYETPHQPSIGIGYAYLDSENQNGIPGEDGNELPFRPRHRVLPSVAYRYRPAGFTLRVWGEYESDTFTTVANDPLDLARAHWLWNFKIQVAPFRLLPEGTGGRLATAFDVGRHLEFFVEGDNVFDVEFGPVTGAGRLASPAAYVFGIAGKF